MSAMGTGAFWVTLIVGTLIAFGFRSSFLIRTDWFDRLGPRSKTVLTLLGPVALAAIVGPRFIALEGSLGDSLEKVMAGVIAGYIAWRTRSVLATIVVGVVTLTLLQFVSFPWPR